MTDIIKPTLSKQEREKEARIQQFAAKGSVKPASTDITKLIGPEQAADIFIVEDELQDVVEEQPKQKKIVEKTLEKTPWANAHPKVVVPLLLRLPEDLHMKLTWLKEHLPNTSIQKLVRIAIEKEVESLIKKTYK